MTTNAAGSIAADTPPTLPLRALARRPIYARTSRARGDRLALMQAIV
jgi:hypothetical protein